MSLSDARNESALEQTLPRSVNGGYLMKAGTNEVRQRYGVPDRWSRSQGMIEGARIRIAHSSGPMARKAAESAAGGVSDISNVASSRGRQKPPTATPAGPASQPDKRGP